MYWKKKTYLVTINSFFTYTASVLKSSPEQFNGVVGTSSEISFMTWALSASNISSSVSQTKEHKYSELHYMFYYDVNKDDVTTFIHVEVIKKPQKFGLIGA